MFLLHQEVGEGRHATGLVVQRAFPSLILAYLSRYHCNDYTTVSVSGKSKRMQKFKVKGSGEIYDATNS